VLSAFWPGRDTGACKLRWGGQEQLRRAAGSWRVQTGPGSDDWNSACRGETYRCCASGFWWRARKGVSSVLMVCEIRGSFWEWWEGKQKQAKRRLRGRAAAVARRERRRPRALRPADSKTTI
jgi:hypothetical protein